MCSLHRNGPSHIIRREKKKNSLKPVAVPHTWEAGRAQWQPNSESEIFAPRNLLPLAELPGSRSCTGWDVCSCRDRFRAQHTLLSQNGFISDLTSSTCHWGMFRRASCPFSLSRAEFPCRPLSHSLQFFPLELSVLLNHFSLLNQAGSNGSCL